MSDPIQVRHYSAYDGWTVSYDLGEGPVQLTISGAFRLGASLVRTAAAAWMHSVMAGDR